MIECAAWRPLATGELAERLRASIRELLMDLSGPARVCADPAAALLYEYADRAARSGEHAAVVQKIVDRAVDSLTESAHSYALHGGFAGVAWLVSHVTEPSADDEDPNVEVDAVLQSLLADPSASWRCDLIAGLAGIGVYFLERLAMPTGRTRARVCLALIVERLFELGTHTREGTTWLTPAAQLPPWQRELAPRGYYNLGVAHGISGVISLLGQICAQQIALPRAMELLQRSVTWLLAQSVGDYPSWLNNDGDRSPSGGSRVAWCHGGLGVSVALLRAARCVKQSDWEAAALTIARRESARRGADAQIDDASLCHGTAGAAHLFNRLFQATGEPMFAEAALHWFERTLALRAWRHAPGLLDGSAGIGLALLAATNETEPNWDRLLAISIPPRAP